MTESTKPNYPYVAITREAVEIGNAIIPANVVSSRYSLSPHPARGKGISELTLTFYVQNVDIEPGVGRTYDANSKEIELDDETLRQLARAVAQVNNGEAVEAKQEGRDLTLPQVAPAV